jgi:hypothetical protein
MIIHIMIIHIVTHHHQVMILFLILQISSTSFYCPVHNPAPPPPSTVCPFHQPYPFYFQVASPQQQQAWVSSPISSSSVFQVRPEKKENRRFTEEQIRILEEYFYKVNKYVSKATIDELSNRTQLKPAQIRVWFNNKRTREQR